MGVDLNSTISKLPTDSMLENMVVNLLDIKVEEEINDSENYHKFL